MHILCLAGDYGTGKSTLASAIHMLKEHDTLILPMAEALRQELKQLGYTDKELYDKPTKPDVRVAMHKLGDFRRKQYGETYWAERWFLTAVKSQKSLIICDDMRFLTDYFAFEQYGKTLTLAYLGNKCETYNLSDFYSLADFKYEEKPNALEVLTDWIKHII